MLVFYHLKRRIDPPWSIKYCIKSRRGIIVFRAKFSNSGNSDLHTVALGNVHEIAHEENLQEENLEKQLGNALGTRTRIRGGNQ